MDSGYWFSHARAEHAPSRRSRGKVSREAKLVNLDVPDFATTFDHYINPSGTPD